MTASLSFGMDIEWLFRIHCINFIRTGQMDFGLNEKLLYVILLRNEK